MESTTPDPEIWKGVLWNMLRVHLHLISKFWHKLETNQLQSSDQTKANNGSVILTLSHIRDSNYSLCPSYSPCSTQHKNVPLPSQSQIGTSANKEGASHRLASKSLLKDPPCVPGKIGAWFYAHWRSFDLTKWHASFAHLNLDYPLESLIRVWAAFIHTRQQFPR